jgi:putative phosphoesterase
MRAAIFSDIHGNSLALEALLQDIEAIGGVDEYWILGDLVAIGFDPIGVLERLSSLGDTRFVRGNTDGYIVTGERPGPSLEQVQAEPSLLSQFISIEKNFTWTLGAVAATGWLRWLEKLPIDDRLTLPDGTRVLLVHASPGEDDGPGFHPEQDEAEISALLSGANADLVLVGHTHVELDITIDGTRVMNPNSISNPFPPDLRASYLLLEADEAGHQLERRHVTYDRDAVIEAVEEVKHPAASMIMQHMTGEREPGWKSAD